jgi:S1-C subfamily serine protease
MKKIILILILFLTFSETAHAITIHKSYSGTGEELVILDTTNGQMAFTKEEAANIEKLKKHTVIVIELDSDGRQYKAAGIAIDKRHILTVDHIISNNSKNYYAEQEGSPSYWATVIKQDPKHDIAILEIESSAPDLIAESLPFAKDIQRKERVYTIGHPKKTTYQLTSGKVNLLMEKGYNDIESMQLDICIKNGNSGGFVINGQGEIVGMIYSVAEHIGNIGYMIGTEDIQKFLRSGNDANIHE